VDLLRARLKTTGVQQLEFFHSDDSWCKQLGITADEQEDIGEDNCPLWAVVDVGGQRSERRKWLKYMDAVDGMLFFVNAHGYKTILYEDASTLRIHEDMQLFESILKSHFKDKPVTVVFTKEDLFHATFSVKKFLVAFPACSVAEEKLTSKKSLQYLTSVFYKLAPSIRSYPIQFIALTTFDVSAVRQSFVQMQSQLLEINKIKLLKLCGLIEELKVKKSVDENTGLLAHKKKIADASF